MKVRLTSSVVWTGDHREAGDVLDVSDIDAHWLMSRGRAVKYEEPQVIDTNRAIGVKKSEPETLTKRRSYKRKTKTSSEF